MSMQYKLFDQHSGISRDFLRGMDMLGFRDYRDALECFQRALQQAEQVDSYRNTYLSYLGLAKVMTGDETGVDYCRRSAHFEKYNGNLYHNLALVELKLGNRKRAVEAIQGGLSIEKDNRQLLQLRRDIGTRRNPVLACLNRDHILNRVLGKCLAAGRARRKNTRFTG